MIFEIECFTDPHNLIWQSEEILEVFITSTLKQAFWKMKPFRKHGAGFFIWKYYDGKHDFSLQNCPVKN